MQIFPKVCMLHLLVLSVFLQRSACFIYSSYQYFYKDLRASFTRSISISIKICILHLLVLSVFLQRSACFISSFYQYSYKEILLLGFELELLGAQPCRFTLYHWRAEKGRHLTYFKILPHMQPLFMTSLIKTPGHKLAAFTIMFSQL